MGFHEKNYDQILLFESQEGEQVNIIEPVLAQVMEAYIAGFHDLI